MILSHPFRTVARALTLAVLLTGLALPALAQETTSVTLSSEWSHPKGTKVPLFVQATHTAYDEQRVTVSGCGLNTPKGAPPCSGSVSAVSKSGTPMGSQFMNFETHVEYTKGFNYTYKVKVEHRAPGASKWRTSFYGKPEVMKISDHGVFAVVPSNDNATGDRDFNDALVLISMWNDSDD